MKELKNRVAVITGAGSGIGAALADVLAAQGMKLALADVEQKALAAVEARVKDSGVECLSAVIDVSDAAAMQEFAEQTRKRHGNVHLLCNNAGVAVGGHSWQHSIEDYEWVFGVNFFGIVNGLRSFLPAIIEHGEDAHVVNTSSMAGLTNAPGFAAYYASKHAALSLSETLHLELEASHPQIGVSVLCPELVRTKIGDAGRNRPTALRSTGPSTPERELYEGSLLTFTAESTLLPKDIATRVVDAVADRRFWILPPPSDPFVETMNARLASIQSRTNPGMAIPLDPKTTQK